MTEVSTSMTGDLDVCTPCDPEATRPCAPIQRRTQLRAALAYRPGGFAAARATAGAVAGLRPGAGEAPGSRRWSPSCHASISAKAAFANDLN